MRPRRPTRPAKLKAAQFFLFVSALFTLFARFACSLHRLPEVAVPQSRQRFFLGLPIQSLYMDMAVIFAIILIVMLLGLVHGGPVVRW